MFGKLFNNIRVLCCYKHLELVMNIIVKKRNYAALMQCCLVNLLVKLVCCLLAPVATKHNQNMKVGRSKMGRRDSAEVERRIEKIMVVEMMKVHFIYVSFLKE